MGEQPVRQARQEALQAAGRRSAALDHRAEAQIAPIASGARQKPQIVQVVHQDDVSGLHRNDLRHEYIEGVPSVGRGYAAVQGVDGGPVRGLQELADPIGEAQALTDEHVLGGAAAEEHDVGMAAGMSHIARPDDEAVLLGAHPISARRGGAAFRAEREAVVMVGRILGQRDRAAPEGRVVGRTGDDEAGDEFRQHKADDAAPQGQHYGDALGLQRLKYPLHPRRQGHLLAHTFRSRNR